MNGIKSTPFIIEGAQDSDEHEKDASIANYVLSFVVEDNTQDVSECHYQEVKQKQDPCILHHLYALDEAEGYKGTWQP